MNAGPVLALLGAALLQAAGGGERPFPSGGGVGPCVMEVLEDGAVPGVGEVGGLTHRTLRVRAPEGVRVRVPPVPSLPRSLEAAGRVRLHRIPAPGGGVVWTFRYPLLAWQAGEWVLPPVEVRGEREGGGVCRRVTDPLRIRVAAPVPAGEADTTMGPLLAAPRPPAGWPGSLWPLVVVTGGLLGLVGSGFVARRTDSRRATPRLRHAGEAELRRRAALEVERIVECAGGEGAPAEVLQGLLRDALERYLRGVLPELPPAPAAGDVERAVAARRASGAPLPDLSVPLCLHGTLEAWRYGRTPPDAREIGEVSRLWRAWLMGGPGFPGGG